MHHHLKPTYQYQFNKYYLLWFKNTNFYTVIDDKFKALLNAFYVSENKLDFKKKLLENKIAVTNFDDIYNSTLSYLNDCNTPFRKEILTVEPQKQKPTNILKKIKVLDKIIALNFDVNVVKKAFFPQVAYLELKNCTSTPDVVFNFYLDAGYLYLFQNNQFILKTPKNDYHVLQGKFIFKLICAIHNYEESKWVSAFHACTVTNGESGILISGVSGKGKSTLTSILAASSFSVLADDVSPLLAKNQHLYYNPTAISLKKGAFNIIKPLINNFDDLPISKFSTSKGDIKYLPFAKPQHTNYPCKAIVLVNYKKDSKTVLKPAELPEVLNAFLSDSWISHTQQHAKIFIEWLTTQKFYSLTYSNNHEAIEAINHIFNS